MKTLKTPLPLKIVSVITSLGMTLSLLGVICSLYYYDKATFYFSLFNFICWTIGGLLAGFIYLKVFDK